MADGQLVADHDGLARVIDIKRGAMGQKIEKEREEEEKSRD
jgi:hypothetical protein